ncbi:PH domain-containing protein [Kitasatospora sp. NBC_01287]|uniref:PH domain-containing protein n=1 Tax=Kitasatospora sp. NBC_01287 TaxID=2903573 RepID=UPI0022576318|nr:PH domain-containing protein [Kitasatospora sp. NBC_01287]MCX4748369.1 PH domain-containing protein [Kitasatospora sp. NBC_01287]
MENLTFSPSRRQLTIYLLRLLALVVVVCGGALLLTGNGPAAAIGAVVIFVPLGAGFARGRTTLSRAGIEVRRALGPTQLIEWSQVKEIREEQRGGTRLLRVEVTGGRGFPLPVPTHTVLAPNPGFAAERDALLGYRKGRGKRR